MRFKETELQSRTSLLLETTEEQLLATLSTFLQMHLALGESCLLASLASAECGSTHQLPHFMSMRISRLGCMFRLTAITQKDSTITICQKWWYISVIPELK